jgi:hypothetical protein
MKNQQQSNRQYQHQHRQRPETIQEQRREFFWRERVKLEMQVQSLLALLQSMEQEWCVLEQRKAGLAQERPRVAAQIMLSGLTGSRYLPAERLFQYRHERLLQEEERLRQATIRYQNELSGLLAQIEIVCLELSYLR